MATIPDVILTGTAYQNVYTATGIVVGTSVTVQNKSSTPVWLQNIALIPDSSSTNGWVLLPFDSIIVDGAIAGLWAFGHGPVGVEVIA